ncbi:MAG: CoB--CoM heterodisulfide reductase iron-sulfur subunit A family protein [Caldiserica bacterium]|nr:CoB--CoM heterodisulfide reductase iron-sulfur subunit A family protein [Caldisericota bacterium]
MSPREPRSHRFRFTKPRVGVFVCHCGHNIAGVVDVKRVVEELSRHPGVVYATDYEYMCSDPGQELLKRAVQDHRLNAVVVAACSPSMHEATFRRAAEEADLNPYLVECANIREHCSWVHDPGEEATSKAIRITKAVVEKAKGNLPLEPVEIPHGERCLVVGGGIAGIQAALDVAEAGYEVILVEKSPTIGGHMAQLSETFPTLDCSQCILTPKMVEVERHPKIRLLVNSEVEEISGFIGNYRVRIRRRPSYVDPDLCNLCGECEVVCPVRVPNEFDRGLSERGAIYIPFPQAVPSTYTLDEATCLGVRPLICGKCAEVCEPGAIDFDMQEEIIEEEVGAIVLATGYELYETAALPEYSPDDPDVLDPLQFERLLSATGPTRGEIRRPSDGKVPRSVVFIQCAGSRDPELHKPYCSAICCMYTAKHALLYKHAVPDGRAIVFYIDIRAPGKGYEEFVHRVMEEDRVLYIRGKVAKVFREGEKLIVWGVDTLSGRRVEVEADLVVLAMAVVPPAGMEKLARILRLSCLDENGFLKEAHPKLRPLETLAGGIFIAGAAQGPKDIPAAVTQGSGAAAKAIALLSAPVLTHSPEVAEVDGELCSGCKVCAPLCPYGAIEVGETAQVNELLCEGCGTCVAACPSGALSLRNLDDAQVEAMVEAALGELEHAEEAVEVRGG